MIETVGKYLKSIISMIVLFGHAQSVNAQWESIDLTLFGNTSIKRMYSNPYADELIMTGTFVIINDSVYMDGVMRWTEDTIQTLSGADVNAQNYHVNNVVDCLAHDGRFYLPGGNHQIEGSPPSRLCIWDTAGFWVEPPSFIRSAESVSLIDSTVYVASSFNGPGDVACFYTYDVLGWDSISIPMETAGDQGFFTAGIIAYHDRFFASGGVSSSLGRDIFEWLGGTTFEHAWPGQSGQGFISDMVIYNGELVVSGYFLESFGNPGNCIAAYDGVNWWPLYNENGFENPSDFPKIEDLMVHDGILYAVGYFTHVDGEEANSVAYWDGSAWHGIGVPEIILASTAEVYNDELYISGLLDYHPQRKKPLAKYTGELPSNPTSIQEVAKENTVTIYPNPTTSSTTLTWQNQNHGNYQLQLYDGQGKLIITETLRSAQGSKVLDLTLYAKGIYFGRLLVGEEMRSFKVVRE